MENEAAEQGDGTQSKLIAIALCAGAGTSSSRVAFDNVVFLASQE